MLPQRAARKPSTLMGEDLCETSFEESLQLRIERLGRERPPVFPSRWAEIWFVFSIIMSQFLTEYFVSGFTILLPTLIREREIP
jgi:hypothetical protein